MQFGVESIFEDNSQFADHSSACEDCHDCDYNCEECDGQGCED